MEDLLQKILEELQGITERLDYIMGGSPDASLSNVCYRLESIETTLESMEVFPDPDDPNE